MRHRWLSNVLRERHVRVAALMLCCLCALPSALHAHIRLDSSVPGAGSTVDAPAQLRLRFSAHIEGRYTSLTLVASDGRRIPLEGFVFEPGSDRDLIVPFPAVPAGAVTIEWRTAGADGHVLEGSFSFTIRAGAGPDTASADTAAPQVVHDHAQPHEVAPHSAVAPLDVSARALHFAALLLLLGALTFRVLIMPRLALGDTAHTALQRRAWRRITLATLALVVAAVMRLWLQSTALHGSERAWSPALLSIMLTDTSWGRAWLLQAFLFALLAAGIAWARPPRDSAARITAVIAAIGLAAIPSLTGHAAGAERGVVLVVINDTIHVLTAGAWVGTLAVLMFDALPAWRGDVAHAAAAANTIDTFSPFALGAAAIVALTGVVNALFHFARIDQLWTTNYGLVLLLKLAFVVGIVAAGAYNWRVVRPRLLGGDDLTRLRRSGGAELGFAVAVLIATAVLTGLPRP